VNILIIVGIAIIGLGLFITFLANKKDDDHSQIETLKGQNEISDKLDTFNNQLNEIINQKLSEDKHNKFIIVENEFDAWAKELNNDYPQLELAHKMNLIQLSEKKITINKYWIPIFTTVFLDLNSMIISINKTMRHGSLSIYKSDEIFPNNLFSKEAPLYYLIIKFNDLHFLRVNLYISSKIDIPQLIFTSYTNLEEAKKYSILDNNQLVTYFDDEKKAFDFDKKGEFSNFETNEGKHRLIPITELGAYLKKITSYQLIISSQKKPRSN